MQQVNVPVRHDPAPSRVTYKLHRLWLTPFYRALIRTGLPIACILIGALAYLRDPVVQQKIVMSFNNARTTIEQRPEFLIQQMHIQGVPESFDKLVRDTLNVNLPISSFHLDLEAMKARVDNIDAIETANLLIGSKGILEVGVVMRVPVLVWRSDKGLVLLDANGQKSGQLVSRLGRTDLPLITGAGVQDHSKEALEIFKKLLPISGRVRGLMRVGERRWDVVLDRNQVLKLPEDQPIAALGRILALHRVQDILNRDITVVDVRDGRKPILRLSEPALDGLKKLRVVASEEEN
jgi:cell division protein FtsQ